MHDLFENKFTLRFNDQFDLFLHRGKTETKAMLVTEVVDNFPSPRCRLQHSTTPTIIKSPGVTVISDFLAKCLLRSQTASF